MSPRWGAGDRPPPPAAVALPAARAAEPPVGCWPYACLLLSSLAVLFLPVLAALLLAESPLVEIPRARRRSAGRGCVFTLLLYVAVGIYSLCVILRKNPSLPCCNRRRHSATHIEMRPLLASRSSNGSSRGGRSATPPPGPETEDEDGLPVIKGQGGGPPGRGRAWDGGGQVYAPLAGGSRGTLGARYGVSGGGHGSSGASGAPGVFDASGAFNAFGAASALGSNNFSDKLCASGGGCGTELSPQGNGRARSGWPTVSPGARHRSGPSGEPAEPAGGSEGGPAGGFDGGCYKSLESPRASGASGASGGGSSSRSALETESSYSNYKYFRRASQGGPEVRRRRSLLVLRAAALAKSPPLPLAAGAAELLPVRAPTPTPPPSPPAAAGAATAAGAFLPPPPSAPFSPLLGRSGGLREVGDFRRGLSRGGGPQPAAGPGPPAAAGPGVPGALPPALRLPALAPGSCRAAAARGGGAGERTVGGADGSPGGRSYGPPPAAAAAPGRAGARSASARTGAWTREESPGSVARWTARVALERLIVALEH